MARGKIKHTYRVIVMKKYGSFLELTQAFAEREGTALLYTDEDGDICSVSYRELAEMIMMRTELARQRGPGTSIIYAAPDPDTIARIFATVMGGRCVIMASPMMPDKVLEEAQEATDRLICRHKDPAEEGELLFFTSGTTNRSKVVRLTPRSLLCSAWSGQNMFECGPDDRILCLLPLSHVFGIVCSLLWGLAYGATIALCPEVSDRLKAPMLFRPTILPAVPAIADAMVRNDALNPELKELLIGAAPCSDWTVQALKEKGINVYIGYGLTETSSGVAITKNMDELDAMYLCPDTEVEIEPDGEIAISTPCMMKGYLGQPETTEGHKLLTGDLGWLDEEGRLHLQGRKKDVIILSDGSKINCPEYEHDIAEMSGETDIALIDIDDEIILVVGAGADTDSLWEAVEEYNKTMLQSQQIADIVEFGRPLPRTLTGKIRRYELQRRYQY